MALSYLVVQGTVKVVEIKLGDAAAIETMKTEVATGEPIHATGQELEYIRKTFSGIRMYSGDSVEWTGEDAKFIVKHF